MRRLLALLVIAAALLAGAGLVVASVLGGSSEAATTTATTGDTTTAATTTPCDRAGSGASGGGGRDEQHRLGADRDRGPARSRSSPSASVRRHRPGLFGGVGTAILVFGFGLTPGEPPVDAMLIIVAVISAAAAMRPRAAWIAWSSSPAGAAHDRSRSTSRRRSSRTCSASSRGRAHLLPIIPVINEVSYANKIRPERPPPVDGRLGVRSRRAWSRPRWRRSSRSSRSTTTSSSTFLDHDPASIIGILAMSFVMSRHGRDLEDDAEYQRRSSRPV